jgi:hypothetical protein
VSRYPSLVRPFLGLALLAVAALGCGTTLPPDRPTRALYLDLRRVVETRQRTEWVADRAEVEALASQTLRSACGATVQTRTSLEQWLDRELAARGGSAEAVWRREGERLTGATREALTLERVRLLVQHAQAHGPAECPFWLRPSMRFAGVHGDARRFVLLLESAGGGAIVVQEGAVSLGGGGLARALPAWGINDRLTVAMGAEVGAIGSFSTSEDARALRASISGAVPVLVRLQDATRIYDFEVALTGRFFDGVSRVQPGVRVSAGLGLSTLRVGAIMPLALLWVGYEVQPALDDLPTTHTFRLGTRVGLDIDP